MKLEAGVIKGRFLECLAFSMLMVVLTNVFFFLVVGIEVEDSSPYPFLRRNL